MNAAVAEGTAHALPATRRRLGEAPLLTADAKHPAEGRLAATCKRRDDLFQRRAAKVARTFGREAEDCSARDSAPDFARRAGRSIDELSATVADSALPLLRGRPSECLVGLGQIIRAQRHRL